MMHGDLSPNGSKLSQICEYVDDFLIDIKVLPRNANTKGKSLLLILLSIFVIWLIVHYHLGYMTALCLSVPIIIICALLYTEHELSKDD